MQENLVGQYLVAQNQKMKEFKELCEQYLKVCCMFFQNFLHMQEIENTVFLYVGYNFVAYMCKNLGPILSGITAPVKANY